MTGYTNEYTGGAGQAVTPGGFEEYHLVVHKRVIEDSSAQMELIRLGMMLSHLVVFAIILCIRVQHTLVHTLQVSCVSYFVSRGATGLYEIVPVERLSTLTYADPRVAILGELGVDTAE